MATRLCSALGVSPVELPRRLDNHLFRVDIEHAPRTNDPATIAYDWWGAGWDTRTEGYWHAYAPLLKDRDLASLSWPDPEVPNLLDGAAAAVARRDDFFVTPNLGMCLFERAWSLRGFDAFLMDMVDEPEWSEELLERITAIQMVLCRRFVALGVDGGYFGDDYGAQRSMLISPSLWRRLMKPRLARMFSVFRDACLPVILHSDGDIRAILPDLVDIGLTVLNPVQPEVLDPEWLAREFGHDLAFYGGISTQGVLPTGTADQVRTATRNCMRKLAPDGTGLLLGPSHRMQSDIPVENVMAMLSAFPGETNA